MHAIRVLSAVLAIQAQALALGADVQQQSNRTQAALCVHMEQLPLELTIEVEEPPPPAPELVESVWDPEPHDSVMEASKCRALLLEVIRRAAHDWVLYRNTRRPERAHAADAYVWLFEEGPAVDGKPAHPNWVLRQSAKEPAERLLSFLTICEVMDLDPGVVRRRIRAMTSKDIMTAGRPAEHRRARKQEGVEDYSSPGQLDTISYDDPNFDSSYEAHFAVTPSYGN